MNFIQRWLRGIRERSVVSHSSDIINRNFWCQFQRLYQNWVEAAWRVIHSRVFVMEVCKLNNQFAFICAFYISLNPKKVIIFHQQSATLLHYPKCDDYSLYSIGYTIAQQRLFLPDDVLSGSTPLSMTNWLELILDLSFQLLFCLFQHPHEIFLYCYLFRVYTWSRVS